MLEPAKHSNLSAAQDEIGILALNVPKKKNEKQENSEKSVKKRQPRQKAHMVQGVSKFRTLVLIHLFYQSHPMVQNADVRVM